jgi:predicted heme/steroid binding protein
MIGNRFYTWFKNYYQWVGGAFSETLLLPLVRATAGLRAGAIRYDESTGTVETYDGTNWNAIPSATGFVPNSRTITINGTTFDLSTNRIYSVGTVTSVGLSMPAAFTVSGSPVTGAGSLSVTGAGLATQYVRGDGTLANFPTTQGGGSSVSYYLNGSVNQGTFSGSTYYEMNRTPILGAGTNFSRNTDGYIASFITDANDPALTEIPGGNFNLELYFSASSGGGNPSFYVELYKYDGTNFTLIASNQSSPDTIVGATKDAYFTAIAVPQTSLTITDRLAIRVYVTVSGRTITFHTENNNLAQIITTFSTGINTLNGLTKQVQFLTTGTSGTDFNINSTNSTHTFNIPTASATNRGALSSSDWTTFNNKVGASRQLTINGTAFDLSADRSWSVGTVTSVGLDTGSAGTDINVSGSPVSVSGNITLNIPTASATNRGALSATDWAIFNAKQNALTLTTTGNSGASTLVGSTLNVPEYTISGLGGVPTSRTLTINGTAFDLSANRSWSVGTVTSVGLTSSTSGITITDSPVTVSGSIGIAISTANGSQQGLLSSTDWTTFNNKQNTLSLTTTGTSGAATLVGATLNVPQYQAQGNYITSLTGEATASGPGAASVTLSTTAVTGKLLTGLNLSGGGTIAATDSILTAFGKVQNQISAMVGGVMYQGTWNASTNTPTLTSSVGVKGYYYIVDVSGTTSLNGISDWRVGDWAIFNGITWDKVDNTDAVSSVNGFTGAVSLTTSHIAEGTNLYYLDSRSRTAISLTTTGNSGAATYDNVSGIINVPQYTLAGLGGVPTTRSITINGTAFDLSADRTYSVGTVTSVGLSTTTTGVTIGNTPVTGSGTITVNIATASGSQNGLLSSTDWTTFNNKQNALTNPVTGGGMAGQLAYYTGTTTITSADLFWDNTNKRLGIGASIPASTLHINNSTGTAELRIDSAYTTASKIINGQAGAIVFNTGGNDTLTLTASGNLGLGVTPSAWDNTVFRGIQIGSNAPAFLVGRTDSFSNVQLGVNAFFDGSWKYVSSNFATRYYQTAGFHAWETAPSGTAGNAISFTQAMTLDASGRLGIGTASPSFKLQVDGVISLNSNTNYVLWGTNASVNPYIQGGSDNSLSIGTGNLPRLTITSGGNVGIGETNPAVALDVAGLVQFKVGSAGVYGYRDTTNADGAYEVYSINGTLKYGIGSARQVIGGESADNLGIGAVGAIRFAAGGIGTERMRITSGGDVLVGTSSSSPSSNVGVKIIPTGRVYCVSSDSSNSTESYGMYSTGAANYRFYVGWGGTIYATSTSISGISDISLKQNIRDLDKGLDEIMKLKPRRFDWINGDGNDNMGFVAQEIESIFPELISEYKYSDNETKKSLKMGDLIPALVKSIQELQAEIERLKN